MKLTAEMRAENVKRAIRMGRGPACTLVRSSEELPKALMKPEEERERGGRGVDTKVEKEFHLQMAWSGRWGGGSLAICHM